MEIKAFTPETRDMVLTQIAAEGKRVVHWFMIDLDENGLPTNCFFVVEAEPSIEENETADMQEALTLLGVEPEE